MTAPSQATGRVVITGIGVAGSPGIGVDDFWSGLTSAPDDDDWSIPVDLADYFGRRELRRLSRTTLLTDLVAREAFADSGLIEGEPPGDPSRYGVILGSSGNDAGTSLEDSLKWHTEGADAISPIMMPRNMPNAPAAHVAMKYGFQGHNETVVTACASGTHALVNALRLIRFGYCDLIAAGGSDASMTPLMSAGFAATGALSPTIRSRPFAPDRDGFVLSEGAGVLILESEEHAVARGATILAEVAGGYIGDDAFHISAPRDAGGGAAIAMAGALADANVDPGDVAWVNAHGTGTPLNDAAEAMAIDAVFAQHRPLVSSLKGSTGHSIAAAGALEAIGSVLAMRHRLVPPSVGTPTVDGTLPGLEYVTDCGMVPWTPGTVLSNNFGFGGHNACVVLLPPG